MDVPSAYVLFAVLVSFTAVFVPFAVLASGPKYAAEERSNPFANYA